MDPSIDLVWLINKNEKTNIPSYITQVEIKNHVEMLKAYACATVIIQNQPFPIIPKGKNQMFIQTWHGDRGFKKCLKESEHADCGRLLEEIDGKCDYALAGSTFAEKFYRSSFGYHGTILKYGCPRNDVLLNPDAQRVKEIKQKLEIDNSTKVLLYAPTLRR